MSDKPSSWSSRPKDKITRAVTKQCPECKEHIPVACKTCLCGKIFTAKKASLLKPTTEHEDSDRKIRRTERIRREKPNFFSSLDMETTYKRIRTVSNESMEDVPLKRKRGRPKGSFKVRPIVPKEPTMHTSSARLMTSHFQEEVKRYTPTEPQEEENIFANISAEKTYQHSVILDELNRKFTVQNFRPL